MKVLSAEYSIPEGNTLISRKIKPFLTELNSKSPYDRKKRTELVHIGKFLAYFYPKYNIKEIYESPDFIIQNNNKTIGVEHSVILDTSFKKKEGYIKSIFHSAEKQLIKDNSIKNDLMNCYIKSDFVYNIHKKKKLINEIIEVIMHYRRFNEIKENNLIEYIISLPHSTFDLLPLFGSWKRKNITDKIVIDAIKKKESKIETYKQNSVNDQWLLLVIGSFGRSTYDVKNNFSMDINSKFKRIFLLEDFDNNLYRIL